jgi:GT2 family glycosyltransferase
VGDARPASNEWIENLLAGFQADDVAVVAGAQVVPEAKATNPLDWFRPVSRPRIEVRRFENQAAFDRSDPETRWRATSLDDVTALYRRRALIEIPFRKVVYGEDVFFALDALSAGWAIAFNPAARVYHYHHESYQTVLKRTIAVASLRYQMTGYLTPRHRFLPIWANGVARLIRNGRLSWRERLRWARYNHELGRALRDGLALVHDAQARGGDSMQQLHEAYCGTPPVPLKVSRERRLPADGDA